MKRKYLTSRNTLDELCSSLPILTSTSILSFALILLSLFTLNYSSIFNTSVAYAADSSTTDLSLDVPTSIAIAVTGSDPQCTGDELDTSDSAVPAEAQLCMVWSESDSNTATGTQTVNVKTNNPSGYTVRGTYGVLTNTRDKTSTLGASCELAGNKGCAALVESSSSDTFNDNHTFKYSIFMSDSDKRRHTAGDYVTKVTYSATANFEPGTDNITTNDDGQTVYAFDYNGTEQIFTAPRAGRYKLEVWGASGCGRTRSTGLGGYAAGSIELKEGDVLYVGIGGECLNTKSSGYGGGGDSRAAGVGIIGGSGGGATHIATTTGSLASHENSKSDILIVAGGGGGIDGISETAYASGANGGGYIGQDGVELDSSTNELRLIFGGGGTQSSGGSIVDANQGSFGLGGNVLCDAADDCGSGGGGGWYGGSSSRDTGGPGGGGSGYIGNSLLLDIDASAKKHMYGYNVDTSDEDSTRTIAGTCSSKTPTADCAKIDNGYAKITYLGQL